MKLKILILIGMIWFFELPAYGVEEAYLCRTAGERWEKDKRTIICKYLSNDASVTWNGNGVYGQQFKKINAEIASQKTAVKSFDCQVKKGNVLTVILAATGRDESNKIKGYYANLRIHLLDNDKFKFDVSCDEQDQIATFCSESFYNSQEIGDYSQCINNYKKTFSGNNALKTHKLLKAECGHYGAKLHAGDCRATPGHSECRALRAIMKLPKNTFVNILPLKFQETLLFSEIHFISYWDACSEFKNAEMRGCSVMLSQAINMIKAKFNTPNLFIFYHSAFWYGKARYSLRINGGIKDAEFDWKSKKFIVDQDEDDEQASPPEYKIKYFPDLNLGGDLPEFYIGF